MPKPEKHVFVCVQNRPPGHPRHGFIDEPIYRDALLCLESGNGLSASRIT